MTGGTIRSSCSSDNPPSTSIGVQIVAFIVVVDVQYIELV
jgi:hypothetical protein